MLPRDGPVQHGRVGCAETVQALQEEEVQALVDAEEVLEVSCAREEVLGHEEEKLIRAAEEGHCYTGENTAGKGAIQDL